MGGGKITNNQTIIVLIMATLILFINISELRTFTFMEIKTEF